MLTKEEQLAAYLMDVSAELTNYLARRLKEKEDVADILSQITVLAYKNIDKLIKKDYDQFCYWVFNVAWKKTCEWYRKRKRLPIPTDSAALFENPAMEQIDADPLAEVLRKDQLERLHDVLGQINLQDKQLYIYRYVEELSYKEISEKTGIGVNTLLTRNRRLLEKLKQLLRDA